MNVGIDELINNIKRYRPSCDERRLRDAYDFALDAHKSQYRRSGEPYIIHPLSIAYGLTEYQADDDSIIAALLHDVVEDTDIACRTIEKRFGTEVSVLVEGVTKVRKEFKKCAASERKAETMRKLISTVVKDQRILLIKLLDRRHNMRTIKYLHPEKQQKIARETLYYYVPLARSISLWEIKTELENICFKILKPVSYARHEKALRKFSENQNDYFEVMMEEIHGVLESGGLSGQARIALLSPYELIELKRKGADISKHFFRMIITTETEMDCYMALGIIHKTWKPVLKYFKDFIAIPKQNRYQALHTTVIGSNGELMMIVIQTRDMYRYSRMSDPYDDGFARKLKDSLAHIDLKENSENYLKCVKEEALCEYVHFFDNDGHSYRLPKGSSLIDFYYHLKTKNVNVPDNNVLSSVNGRRSPFKRVIRKDDVISFSYGGNGSTASPQLLRYAKTSRAKKAIKESLSHMSVKEAVKYGRKIFHSELKRTGLESARYIDGADDSTFLKELNEESADDFYEKIGRGRVDTGSIISTLYSLRKHGGLVIRKKRPITVTVTNNRNRVGFVKNVLDTFQKLNISIVEIKGYSPSNQRHGIVELKITENLTSRSFRNVLLPLCNALEQVESVAKVKIKLT